MENRWINASEMEPDEGSRVIVFTEHDMFGKSHYVQRDITMAEYSDGKYKCANFLGNRVLAWMNLPEPPKEV